MTFEEKTEINKWAQARYDELMREGRHGHYETMFRVIHEVIARVTDDPPSTFKLACGHIADGRTWP